MGKLANLVYKIINKSPRFRKDFRLLSQMEDAAVSSRANTSEGFPRRSNKEFIQFLFISKSSVAAAQSQLYAALNQEYTSNEDFDKVYDQAEIVSRMDSGFIKYLHFQLNPRNKPNKLDQLK